EEQQQRGQRRGAGQRAPDRQAARCGGVEADETQRRGGRLGGGGVDGVTGRVRLVPGDVELPHAEREVDRVEVFEGSRQQREMGGQVDQQQREARRSVAGHQNR